MRKGNPIFATECEDGSLHLRSIFASVTIFTTTWLYLMTVAFTQYLRPDGRKRSCGFNRPPKVEALAEQFIAAGGRYECEELMTGHASLTAVYEVDGG
jgi:hypothetical protein